MLQPLPDGLLCRFTGTLGADVGAHDAAAPDDLSRFGAHAPHYSVAVADSQYTTGWQNRRGIHIILVNPAGYRQHRARRWFQI